MDRLLRVTELGAHNASLCAVHCEAGSVNLWAEQASSYEAGGPRHVCQGMGGRFRGPYPSREFVPVIAERAIGGEGFLVEQPLGSTAQANLV